MAVRSRETLRRLPLLLDCDPVYTRCGWLFLVDEETRRLAVENAEMQDEEGLDTVEVDDLQEFLPGRRGGGHRLRAPRAGLGLRRPGRDDERLRRGAAGAPAGARSRARRSRRSRSRAARVRGVRVGGEVDRVRQPRARRGPVDAEARRRRRPRAAARDHPRAGRRLRDRRPSRRSRARSRRRSTASTCARRPSTATAHLLVGRGFPKEYEQVDPDAFDEDVDAAFEQDVRETRRTAAAAARRHARGRRPRRPVRRDARLASAARAGRRLRGPVPRDRRQRPLLQARARDRRDRRRRVLGLQAPVRRGRATSRSSRFAEGREFRSTYGGNRA